MDNLQAADEKRQPAGKQASSVQIQSGKEPLDESSEDLQSSEPSSTNPKNTKRKLKMLNGKYLCPVCHAELSTRQSLWCHQKKKHPESMSNASSKKICCPDCPNFKGAKLMELLNHQNREHGQNYTIQHANFTSEEEFNNWRSDLEREYGTYFVKQCGERNHTDHRTVYFYCNRSGFSKSRGTGKRTLKSQGSAKVDGHCCSFLKKTTSLITGHVNVNYCVDHMHGTEIAHLKMSDQIRSSIVGMLTSGADSQIILNELRDKMHELDGRDRIISRKDIQNIGAQFNIKKLTKVLCDSVGVEQESTHQHTGVFEIQENDDDDDHDSHEGADENGKKNTGEHFSRILHSSNADKNLGEAKATFLKVIGNLIKVAESAPDADTIRQMMFHVKAAEAIGKGFAVAVQDHDYGKKQNFPSNKKFDHQKRFFSTKQAAKRSASTTLMKPSESERKKRK